MIECGLVKAISRMTVLAWRNTHFPALQTGDFNLMFHRYSVIWDYQRREYLPRDDSKSEQLQWMRRSIAQLK